MGKNVWRYYCRFRPLMPGAVPRQGLVRSAQYNYPQSIDGVCSWGYVEYDRKLTNSEVYEYELAESRNNPLEYDQRDF